MWNEDLNNTSKKKKRQAVPDVEFLRREAKDETNDSLEFLYDKDI